eukprot:6655875-Prymnesium_polylepis.1
MVRHVEVNGYWDRNTKIALQELLQRRGHPGLVADGYWLQESGKAFQTFLHEQGHYHGDIDGQWDRPTKLAAERWTAAHDLGPEFVTGAWSIEAIKALQKLLNNPPAAAAAAGAGSGAAEVPQGATARRVNIDGMWQGDTKMALQELLQQRGHTGLVADGNFGVES